MEKFTPNTPESDKSEDEKLEKAEVDQNEPLDEGPHEPEIDEDDFGGFEDLKI